MIRNRLKQETHNDGVARIYEVGNISVPPRMPKQGLILKETLRYRERTVGLTRQQMAKQDGVNVSYVLRCPLRRNVSALDVAIPNDGKQYQIRRVTYPEDATTPVMDIELSEVTSIYDLT